MHDRIQSLRTEASDIEGFIEMNNALIQSNQSNASELKHDAKRWLVTSALLGIATVTIELGLFLLAEPNEILNIIKCAIPIVPVGSTGIYLLVRSFPMLNYQSIAKFEQENKEYQQYLDTVRSRRGMQ